MSTTFTTAVTAVMSEPRALIRAVPQINLLPPEVVQRRQVRTTQKALVVVASLTLAVVGSAYFVGHQHISQAQEDVDAAQQRAARLQQEQSKYAEAPAAIAQLDAARAARSSALADDVAWYQYVDDISRAAPDTVWLQSVNGALDDATGAVAATAVGAPVAVPLTSAGVAKVTVTGQALAYESVASYLERLAALPGVASPFLTTSAANDSTGKAVVSFTITAVLTTDALSHHYDQEGN